VIKSVRAHSCLRGMILAVAALHVFAQLQEVL
jgi:hypothetical protein